MRLLLLALLVTLSGPALAQRLGARTAAPASHLPVGDLQPGTAQDEAAVALAARHPLGTLENPVRVGGPEGARAYLARLRCADGRPATILGESEAGVGGFGSLATGFAIRCGGGEARIVFDVHHQEHVETAAPTGFTLQPL